MSDNIVYQTVFDTARQGFHTWKASALGLPFMAGGVYMAWLVRRFSAQPAQRRVGTLVAVAVILLGMGISVTVFVGLRAEYRELCSALESGRYEVVEGIVSDFTAKGPGSHPPESWSVGGHRYTFYSAITSGFDQSGQVHPGGRVRIADVRGRIARLEMTR